MQRSRLASPSSIPPRATAEDRARRTLDRPCAATRPRRSGDEVRRRRDQHRHGVDVRDQASDSRGASNGSRRTTSTCISTTKKISRRRSPRRSRPSTTSSARGRSAPTAPPTTPRRSSKRRRSWRRSRTSQSRASTPGSIARRRRSPADLPATWSRVHPVLPAGERALDGQVPPRPAHTRRYAPARTGDRRRPVRPRGGARGLRRRTRSDAARGRIGGLAAQEPIASVIAGATKPEQVRASASAGEWQPVDERPRVPARARDLAQEAVDRYPGEEEEHDTRGMAALSPTHRCSAGQELACGSRTSD